jgi:hypothetical protein
MEQQPAAESSGVVSLEHGAPALVNWDRA